jgi:hypothetical protein
MAPSAASFANDTSIPILSGGASSSSGSSAALPSLSTVPEPASLVMAVMGAIGLGFYAFGRRR